MDSKTPRTVATVSTKLPAELVHELDEAAFYRGVTRSWLVRELVEAYCDGRVLMTPPRRSRGLTTAELGTSDVGTAAVKAAQDTASAALDHPATAGRVLEAAPDPEAVAHREAARRAGHR